MTNLITVRYTCHAAHHTEDVVVYGVHTDLSSGSSRNRAGRKNKLEDSIVNAREVARTGRLVLLRAEGEGVHVDTRVGAACVVLEGLDNIEVVALTLREAVLAVKLELGRDDGVLTPAVHIEGGLRENEGAGIGDVGLGNGGAVKTREGTSAPLLLRSKAVIGKRDSGARDILNTSISSTGHLEEAVGGNEAVGTRGLVGATEGVDRIGEGIDRISVVEGLGTEALVEHLGGI